MRISGCNENWENMTPNNDGRHCQICDLTVHNLKDNSLDEIDQLKDKKGKICGRVTKLQLSEFQYLHPMKRFAIALFLVFGSSLFTVSYSQIIEENTQIQKNDNRYVIKFTAEEKDGTPLKGVFINFDTYDDYKEGTTDKNGNLTLDFTNQAKEIEVYVNVSYESIFGSVKFKASPERLNKFDKIIFDPENYTITIGDHEIFEEIIMGDIAPIDWQEDEIYEQKTENN